MEKKELTLEECAEQLGVSTATVLYRLKKGELDPVYHSISGKGGRVRNFTMASVARFIKRQIEKEDVRR